VIRTANSLIVRLFGISNVKIAKLGKFSVRVFYCRRYEDCMSVFDFEGELCDLLSRPSVSGHHGDGKRGAASGVTKKDDSGVADGHKATDDDKGITGPTSLMGMILNKDGDKDEGDSCALEMFETFTFEFRHPEPIPPEIFRGTYDLQIQLEGSCFWVEDVEVVAGEMWTSLGDYRDVILAFVVASSSSYVLGQYINPLTGGLLPQITGFLLMG
ncbi:unnamed protein product, partial [Amoebophrya sp. A25]